ncbi:MAG: hypothetical protein EA387_04085 [Nitriliruptor sp.]|nr:MAG: hypothetical protein EA387_04085 [Nitriliruptor sp.]
MSEMELPSPGVGVHGGARHLVLYPTWVGLLAAGLVPPGLLLLGLLAWASTGTGAVTRTLLVAGTGTVILAGRNFPRHVVIGTDGIERRCLLRRHVLPFSEVAAIERAPAPRLAAARAARSSDPTERQRVMGGLLATGHGRRRWMLTDQPESREEYDHLAALLVAGGGTDLQAARPAPGTTPTSLYRRRIPPLPR